MISLKTKMALTLLLTGAAVGCKTTTPAAGLKDDAGGAAADDVNAKNVALLRKSCAGGGCHQAVAKTKLISWRKSTKTTKTCVDGAASDGDKVACLDDSPGVYRTLFGTPKVAGWVRAAAAQGTQESDITQSIADRASQKMPAQNKPILEGDGTAVTDVDGRMSGLIDWLVSDGAGAYLATLDTGTTGGDACTNKTTPALTDHLAKMKDNGWASFHRTNRMPMFGCPKPPDDLSTPFDYDPATDCFKNSAAMNASAQPGKIALKTIAALTPKTYYWTRSSMDGAFVGNGFQGGGQYSATVDELDENSTTPKRHVQIQAQYDPNFSADNKTFMFHGSQGGFFSCNMSILTDGARTKVDARGPESSLCSTRGQGINDEIDVYMSVGAALDSSGYFIIEGSHENDDPGAGGVADRSANFPANAGINVYHFGLDDTGKPVQDASGQATTPNAGDWQISPSSRLMVGRFGNADHQIGYTLRTLTIDTTGGTAQTKVEEIGSVCSRDGTGKSIFTGDKAAFSLDERFLAVHHYDTTNKSGDIYVYDIQGQKAVRVTNMPQGVIAVYPHFRADGWLYFTVRDRQGKLGGGNHDYVVASDAALQLMKGTLP